MKATVYNAEGKQVGELELPAGVFEVAWNPALVHQVATVLASNRRQVTAHTKTRGEVSGGGKKPWAQKGTGRARHGSTRSPIWKGGGTVFGPRADKNYKKSVNVKMRKKALLALLSERARTEGGLILIEELPQEMKTKALAQLFAKLPLKSRKALVALPEMSPALIKAANNIPRIETMQAKDLNPLDVLRFPSLVLPKAAVRVLEETFGSKK